MHVNIHAAYVLECLRSYLESVLDQECRGIYAVSRHAGNDYDALACANNHACMISLIHAIFLRAQVHILAKMGHIRYIYLIMGRCQSKTITK